MTHVSREGFRFFDLIDVVKWECGLCSGISNFFKVIGLNPITIYLAYKIIPFRHISEFFLGWLANG